MSRCIALITLYEPDRTCIENAKQIGRQVDRLYLCDNSKWEHEADFADVENAEYLFFGENRGISGAFNSVLKDRCKEFSMEDFVIFFDQDTTAADGHIRKMMQRFEELENEGLCPGCLGPVYYNPYTDSVRKPRIRRRLSGSTYTVESVITSSMLTRYRILYEAGFWNERVFLDMADWDLCWRVRKKGFVCCSAEDIILTHRLGENNNDGGKNAAMSRRMFREYYQTREALYLLHRSYTPFRFRLKFIKQLTLSSAVRLAVFPERTKRLRIYRTAAGDYRKKISGPYKEQVGV